LFVTQAIRYKYEHLVGPFSSGCVQVFVGDLVSEFLTGLNVVAPMKEDLFKIDCSDLEGAHGELWAQRNGPELLG
jgi:hypothetical protein